MLNITKDRTSGSLIVFDPDSQTSYVYNPGDTAWVLTSAALVWIMIPGIGFFYSGLLRRKNALSMIYLSMMTIGVVSFQWFFLGYSLTFSDTGSPVIGNFKYFALRGVLEKPSIANDSVPAIVFCVFELMFASFTPMLAVGAVAERARLGPLLFFVLVWSTLVYDPIAYWTWNPNGWGNKLGNLDFAGGTPVHISSGAAALAISFYLGRRHGYGKPELAYTPHNNTYIVLGTAFIWFGWFGFNGGSALSAGFRAAHACIVTNLAGGVGGLTWLFWDYRVHKTWSVANFCSGAIAGLVAITPGSGYVGIPAAVLFGFLAGTGCRSATNLKFFVGCDDALDIFASHAIGGIIGNLLTAIFAQASVAAYDGTEIPGGWLDRHFIQLAFHVADSFTGLVYSFVMTWGILWAMHRIRALRLRVELVDEQRGIDLSELGEDAYSW